MYVVSLLSGAIGPGGFALRVDRLGVICMIRARRGSVTRVTRLPSGALEAEVVCEGRNSVAICYPDLTGPVAPGDWVILNTNAVQLELGTGGYHFVMCSGLDHAAHEDW